MSKTAEVQYYSPSEERLNIFSHALGLILSISALVILVLRASRYGDAWHVVSFSIFGASLIVLFAASTVYHSAKDPGLRARLRVVDHASIYVLIAGTYTPFTLVTLHGTTGWVIFAITWSMALCGIVLKLYFTGRYRMLSTSMYVFMGWIAIFVISPLIDNLPPAGLFWLLSGGVAYTLGAVLYGIKRIGYNHAIFHAFVLIGACCHFVAVYLYVLPAD